MRDQKTELPAIPTCRPGLGIYPRPGVYLDSLPQIAKFDTLFQVPLQLHALLPLPVAIGPGEVIPGLKIVLRYGHEDISGDCEVLFVVH